MTYIFQRIIQNHFQWTRPSPERIGPTGEGTYVKENGFGHEDWNFNKNLLIEGNIYGYCYYRPAKSKQDDKFNIAFATYDKKRWYLTGFYLNAEFIDDPPIKNEVLEQKRNDLLQLGSSLSMAWSKLNDKEFLEKLKVEAKGLKWQVAPNDVIRTVQPLEIPNSLFNSKNYHITTPKEINNKIFYTLYDYAQNYTENEEYDYELEFPEGREVEKKHRFRERNQAAIRKAKELFKEKHGRLFCQICGFDFNSKYGEIGLDFIEGHHTLPMSKLSGEVKTKVEDIALVCSNCHRMLHRKRPWLEMTKLKMLIKNKA